MLSVIYTHVDDACAVYGSAHKMSRQRTLSNRRHQLTERQTCEVCPNGIPTRTYMPSPYTIYQPSIIALMLQRTRLYLFMGVKLILEAITEGKLLWTLNIPMV